MPSTTVSTKRDEERLSKIVMGLLSGGTQIVNDDSIAVGEKFTIPRGMTYEAAFAILERKREEDESQTKFHRKYRYRPYDGAYATMMVIREKYGIGIGKPIYTFFGKEPPELIDVKIGVEQSVQCPWGKMELPDFEGCEVYTHGVPDRDYGNVFALTVVGARKHRARVEEFFDLVGDYLTNHSIYRGKAIIGHQEPEFLDLSAFAPSKVIYAEETLRLLDSVLWGVMRYTDEYRRDRMDRKRAVLLFGPYGTGKTLTGMMTAKVATDSGWTFVTARPGRDDLMDTLRMARMYQPACVFFEDVDAIASTAEDDILSQMLEMFDGITAKGGELVVAMTTNHIERIHKAMLRPGRLDALVHIGELDRNGVEALVKAATPDGKLADDIDYDDVYAGMKGFFPAFVREAVNRASSIALARVEGRPQYKISTIDLITAADSLRPQLQFMEEALEGEPRPEIDKAMGRLVKESMHNSRILDGEQPLWRIDTETAEASL